VAPQAPERAGERALAEHIYVLEAPVTERRL